MGKKGRKAKPLFEGSLSCAWCRKLNKVTIKDKVIKPSVPAEKERVVSVEKDSQTKLSDMKKK